MTATDTLYQSELPSLTLIARGKVRDIYAIDDDTMLIVATDRLSAFDVILPDPIPNKGRVLTSISNFWFKKMQHVMPNHITNIPLEQVIPNAEERAPIEGRAVVVKRL
ncbi:MAG: phosphoribosylaminoimidazolesuccinocarboxamide synthase, partial [Methylococcales bacterium]|nr:phosphoribosylaminoimidazolesuccinocarboxamide synthase [Methylococcales bacterium]